MLSSLGDPYSRFLSLAEIHCSDGDNLLHILALLKLDLVQKKVLIFTKSSEVTFRLLVFLEQAQQVRTYLSVVRLLDTVYVKGQMGDLMRCLQQQVINDASDVWE